MFGIGVVEGVEDGVGVRRGFEEGVVVGGDLGEGERGGEGIVEEEGFHFFTRGEEMGVFVRLVFVAHHNCN